MAKAPQASEPAKKPRTSNPLPTDPKERFKEMVNRKGGAAITSIRALAAIGGQRGDKAGQYSYTDAEVDTLASTLKGEIDATVEALKNPKTKHASGVKIF